MGTRWGRATERYYPGDQANPEIHEMAEQLYPGLDAVLGELRQATEPTGPEPSGRPTVTAPAVGIPPERWATIRRRDRRRLLREDARVHRKAAKILRDAEGQ